MTNLVNADENNTVISETQYDYGTAVDDINVPANPTKENTAQYTYIFEHWDKDIVPVTEDATYTAVYSSTVNLYTIKFVDDDNEEISCITKEITQVTYIEYNSITNDEIIKTDSYIIFIKNLIKILSDQVSEKNNRIEILTKKTTRDKLLEYFKQQASERGTKSFTIPISFTELANHLSVDRSAMTREITYLKDDGIIKTNGRRITLLY